MITLIVPATDAKQGLETMSALMAKVGTPTYPVMIHDRYRTGYTAAVNIGLLTAMDRGEDACICVDDARPVTDNWLATLKSALDLGDTIWFAGPSGDCRTHPQNKGRPGDPRRPRLVSHVAGFCWLIAWAALQRVGFLRADLENYGSEVDYQWRARKFGGRAVWVPEVYMEHGLHPPRQPEWDEDNEKFNRIWQ